MTWKQTLKKTWHFIWHEDSVLSWVVNIILAFILIKFIIYPGLGLVFGTPYPVVAVVSSSMEHDGDFYEWWNVQEDFYLKNNITDIDFRLYPFVNGFNKGDIMVLLGTKPEKIEIGDVIVYQAKKPYPIIHRVINIRDTGGELYFETKGDNNQFQIRSFDLDEKNVSSDQYIGRAVFKIPFLGYVKIWFVELMGKFGYGGIIS
ncbi:MAG: signal peptidase I [archaeon]